MTTRLDNGKPLLARVGRALRSPGLVLVLAAVVALALRARTGTRAPTDLVGDLPLRGPAAAEIGGLCRRVGEDAGRALEGEAEVRLRAIGYVVEGDERHVEASFRARAAEGVVWHDLRLGLAEGRLELLPTPFRTVSPLADRLVPALEAAAARELASSARSSPLAWPVAADAHAALTAEMERLLALYVARLRASLEGEGELTGRLGIVEYAQWFHESKAKVAVELVVESDGRRLLTSGLALRYSDGRFLLVSRQAAAGASGPEPAADASTAALDAAIEQWRDGRGDSAP